MLNYLTGLVSGLGHWGYLIVFLVVKLECQAFLGLLMPGESLVILSGFLARQRLFDLDTLIVTVSAAAIAGDSIGYELGRRLGRNWLFRHGARLGLGQGRVEHIERFFLRHGGKAVFAAHFMHMGRALMPCLTAAMLAITFLGSPAFLTIASTILGLWLALRRAWYRLITLTLVMPGGALLNLLLKYAFHRQRPFFEDPLVTLTGYSFPSGHTMGSTLFCGLLAWFVAFALRRWRWRVFVILGAFFVVLLIGFSRIYLGAHYLSDVLGAMAAGAAWLALCITAVSTLRRYGHQQSQKSL